MFWYVIILVLLFWPICFTFSKRNKKSQRIAFKYCLFLLLFFMCCRSINVGKDTHVYVYKFFRIQQSSLKELLQIRNFLQWDSELLYEIYNKLVSLFSTNAQSITISNGVFIIALLGSVVKKQSAYPLLSIWLYLTLGFYQTQMNVTQNAIAILLCYRGLIYIQEKKPFLFLISIVVATSFHLSSIAFLPMYWVINGIKLDTKPFIILFFLLLFVCTIGFNIIRTLIIRLVPSAYSYGMGNRKDFESLLVGIFHFLTIALLFFCIDSSKRSKIVVLNRIGTWMFLLEMLSFALSLHYPITSRLAALYSPYLIISIPNYLYVGVESNKKRMNIIAIMIVVMALQYILRLHINNIGSTLPYSFFWTTRI